VDGKPFAAQVGGVTLCDGVGAANADPLHSACKTKRPGARHQLRHRHEKTTTSPGLNTTPRELPFRVATNAVGHTTDQGRCDDDGSRDVQRAACIAVSSLPVRSWSVSAWWVVAAAIGSPGRTHRPRCRWRRRLHRRRGLRIPTSRVRRVGAAPQPR
jgi:hypothetical protein